ncbi:hypothetical protein FA95DRAFT_1121731 [Auriscalpium vulgare]|uniref:Uncharacterized protein n=1 Tax=Auriscalpium vulgare TaxID=40419 RepID=A0ACB8RWI4_9AGAM|nr:hypothetical protein FA95DRAFT_1121731 [Auriscalpium vulgare]
MRMATRSMKMQDTHSPSKNRFFACSPDASPPTRRSPKTLFDAILTGPPEFYVFEAIEDCNSVSMQLSRHGRHGRTTPALPSSAGVCVVVVVRCFPHNNSLFYSHVDTVIKRYIQRVQGRQVACISIMASPRVARVTKSAIDIGIPLETLEHIAEGVTTGDPEPRTTEGFLAEYVYTSLVPETATATLWTVNMSEYSPEPVSSETVGLPPCWCATTWAQALRATKRFRWAPHVRRHSHVPPPLHRDAHFPPEARTPHSHAPLQRLHSARELTCAIPRQAPRPIFLANCKRSRPAVHAT